MKSLIASLALVLFAFIGSAQFRISGYVEDAETGEKLFGTILIVDDPVNGSG